MLPKTRRTRPESRVIPSAGAILLIAAGHAAAFGLQAIPALASPPAERPPTPALATARESVSTRLNWEPGEPRSFLSEPGRVWLVTPETAVTGWAISADRRREIQQTRLRIDERQGDSLRPLAWLQHVGNTEILLLRPGDSRLDFIGTALSDSLRPWPNTCSLSLLEQDRALDLNLNNRMELAVRFFATVSEPASGIVLVEPDSAGAPRLVAPEELADRVLLREAVLTAIRWQPPSRDPILELRVAPLYRCRFLSLLGIRGATECETCCEIPVMLVRTKDGAFRAAYDREVHSGLLERLKADLTLVQEGRSDPMSSEERAALARAASFFYLTGHGAATGDELRKALGARATQPAALLLLKKLDEFFLPESAPRGK
jgi:hypothetical protein